MKKFLLFTLLITQSVHSRIPVLKIAVTASVCYLLKIYLDEKEKQDIEAVKRDLYDYTEEDFLKEIEELKNYCMYTPLSEQIKRK